MARITHSNLRRHACNRLGIARDEFVDGNASMERGIQLRKERDANEKLENSLKAMVERLEGSTFSSRRSRRSSTPMDSAPGLPKWKIDLISALTTLITDHHLLLSSWHGEVEIITNDQGNRTTPSCVAFTESRRFVGDAAKNQDAVNSYNTIFAPTKDAASVPPPSAPQAWTQIEPRCLRNSPTTCSAN
ncbi:Heat shock 70 kDa protein cognate 1 [Bienertia sinuspersici]